MNKSENKTGIYAVADVKVSLWKYEYLPFENAEAGIDELEKFRQMLESGRYAEGAEYDAAFVSAYCADIIEECICRGGRLECAADLLVKVYGYCRKRLSGLVPLTAMWLCTLYLSKGEYSGLQRLSELGIGGFPFEKDIAAGELICAFLQGDFVLFRKRLAYALSLISEYDITSSAAYSKNSEIYKKALDAVMPAVFEYVLSEKGKNVFMPERVTARIQAFPGLPCVCECERWLEVTYTPFSSCEELFGLIDSCVKHTDNLLRQGLGIKSKIVGFTLGAEYRKLVAETIREALPGFLPMPMKVGRKPKKKIVNERAAKSKEAIEIYEPIDLNIDFAKAKKLEAESWKLTDMLSGDYGGNDISFNVDEVYVTDDGEKASNDVKDSGAISDNAAGAEIYENEGDLERISDIPEEWQELYGLLYEDEKKILCLCANGLDASVFARKKGGMIDGYADSVNEKASDAYGDIIVETDGSNIYFIEDYREELTEIFRDMYDTEVL